MLYAKEIFAVSRKILVVSKKTKVKIVKPLVKCCLIAIKRETKCHFTFQVKKEYRKFIRRHSWLPKCLRCSKTVTGSSGGSSGTSGVGAGANGGKDFGSHNTSSNPSAPTTDSSGLSPHAASNVGTSPNNHSNLTAACNNTNLSINVNLNNLALRSPVGPHQLHLMTPSNHNRHPTHQGIQRPLIHQTKKKNPLEVYCFSLSLLDND